jgi:hypothetical protein
MERPIQAVKPLASDPVLSVLGQQAPILQELWAIKAQINKDAQFSVNVRCKQVQGLNWKVACARLGLAAK